MSKKKERKKKLKTCSIGFGTKRQAEAGKVASKLSAKARRAMRKLLVEAGERASHVTLSWNA